MSKKTNHHLDAATLMSFSAGTLAEPLAAVAASHISTCSRCSADVLDMDLIGSALIGSMAVEADCPGLVKPKIKTEGTVIQLASVRKSAPSAGSRLPEPIARRYRLTYETIPWRLLVPGVWQHRLPLSQGVEGDLRLLKISAGVHMPEHGHGGSELTVVLDGAYADASGAYGVGDIQDVDEDCEHQPVADSALGCVCLIASERPAKFKSLIGRIMQPWTGM